MSQWSAILHWDGDFVGDSTGYHRVSYVLMFPIQLRLILGHYTKMTNRRSEWEPCALQCERIPALIAMSLLYTHFLLLLTVALALETPRLFSPKVTRRLIDLVTNAAYEYYLQWVYSAMMKDYSRMINALLPLCGETRCLSLKTLTPSTFSYWSITFIGILTI